MHCHINQYDSEKYIKYRGSEEIFALNFQNERIINSKNDETQKYDGNNAVPRHFSVGQPDGSEQKCAPIPRKSTFPNLFEFRKIKTDRKILYKIENFVLNIHYLYAIRQ